MPGLLSWAPRKRWFPETQRTTAGQEKKTQNDSQVARLPCFFITALCKAEVWNIQTWAGTCFPGVLRCILQSPEWTWPPRPPWIARPGPVPPGLWWTRCWTGPPGGERRSTTTQSVWDKQLRLVQNSHSDIKRPELREEMQLLQPQIIRWLTIDSKKVIRNQKTSIDPNLIWNNLGVLSPV